MVRAALVTIALALLVGLVGCDRSSKAGVLAGKAKGHNVLFITLDTTRADRIGCYGYRPAATPAIDSLAKKGVLFERAYCEVPITLPSHCSMMTGLYPREHGVRMNGAGSLSPQYPTLAAAFKKSGYRTGAFVAAFVLDSRFGLDQGFDTYNDDMGLVTPSSQQMELQQTGNIVTDRALSWLETAKAEPFFCWVHYYDPHDPYTPPAGYEKHEKPYDGEIAFMDSQIKRLLDWLEKAQIADRTLIVVAGDHGEGFGEHGEHGHTLFLYQVNTHVPLLFVDRSFAGGIRVSNTVELVDIFPTVLELCGIEAAGAKAAKSLTAALAGRRIGDEDCYSESHYGFDSYGFAEQRSLTTPEWKYISSTRPELYHLTDDPDELRNLHDAKPEVAKDMLTRLLDKYDAMPEGKAVSTAQSEAARQALAGLGYASGSGMKSQFLTKGLPDPKAMLGAVRKVQMAKTAIQNKKNDEAILLLEQAVRESPDSFQVHYTLGATYLQLDRVAPAIPELRRSIELNPAFAPAFTAMGDALLRQGNLPEAAKHFKMSLTIEELDAEVHAKLAKALAEDGLGDQAMPHFLRALEIFPKYADVHHEMGVLFAATGRFKEAVGAYEKALAIQPERPITRYNYGYALLQMRDPVRAVEQLREATRLKPDYGDAWVNLGVAFGMQGKLDDAKTAFEKAMQIPGAAAEAHLNWGIALEKAGRTGDAQAQYAMAVKADPGNVRAVDAVVKNALSHGRTGDAVQALRETVKRSPDHLNFVNLLASILATARDEKMRNGAEAVQLAMTACGKTEYKHPVLLGTLAAAYAEIGRYDDAIGTARKAIEYARSAGQANLVGSLNEQLDLYQKREPYRNPKF